MNGIVWSQVFFIISSVGFVLLWIFVAIFVFYLIRISRSFSRIMDMIEDNVNKVGDTTKEMLEDLRSNKLFSFFVKKRKKSKKE
jgi:hypothetical protein